MDKRLFPEWNGLSMFTAVTRQQGIWAAVKKIPSYIYRKYLRILLPSSKYVKFNNVPVDIEVKVGDEFLPENWIPRSLSRFEPNFEDPTYESALAKYLRNKVDEGDRVVVVGAGWGVTSVIAAQQVGTEGCVEVFEGAKKMVKEARKTVRINGVSERTKINHSVVAKQISLYDDPQGASIIQAEELPTCDVLELDCEGAEKNILSNLKFKPRTIIVETHGIYGSPTSEIKKLLSKMGYKICSTEVADEGWRDSCLKKDIMVVCAHVQGQSSR